MESSSWNGYSMASEPYRNRKKSGANKNQAATKAALCQR